MVAWTTGKREDILPEQDFINNSTLYWIGKKPVEVSAASIVTGGHLLLSTEFPFVYKFSKV